MTKVSGGRFVNRFRSKRFFSYSTQLFLLIPFFSRYPCFFIFNLCEFSSHVLIFIDLYSFYFVLFIGWGISNKKQSTCIISFLFTGVGRGAGNLILCFHDGFCFIFYVLGKKLTGSFLHWEYFYGPVFTGFVFGKSHLHSKGGGLSIFSRALDF